MQQVRGSFESRNPVVVTSNGSVDCGGRPAIVRGSNLSVSTTNCPQVLVEGDSNTVALDQLNPGLGILGSFNTVTFRSGQTNGITIVGNNNGVRPG